MQEQTGRSSYLVFGVVAAALLASSMQNSMVSVALPDLIEGLDAPLAWVGWVLTIYTLSQAVAMPIVGKLSDELGRRRMFAGGVLVFGAASVACGIAPNIYVLIAARLVQGTAGGSLLPSAYGIVGDAYPENRARMLGLISSVFPVGSIIGPVLGGVIVEHFDWRWTFIVNAPLAMLVALAATRAIPTSVPKERQRIDIVGAALLSACVLGVIYALTEVAHTDRDPVIPVAIASAIIGLVSGVILMRHETRTKSPLLDTELIWKRPFIYMNGLNFVYGMVIFGMFSFIPLYAQTAYGLSSAEAGWMLTPRALCMIGASVVASFFLPKTGYRMPIQAGLIGMAIITTGLSQTLHDVSVLGIAISDGVYVTFLVALSGLAFGFAGPAANNGGIELVPTRIAAVTGLRGMFRSVGGTVGTAIIVLIVARAPSEVVGLERTFMVLAGLSLVAALLTLGVPSRVGRAAVPVTPAAGSPQPTAVAAEVAVAEAPAAGNETAEAARERTSA
ncbi:MAG: MFS transporter [Dehalococcoidia bacterium]|nr:MFS transporter [Dehalococcoidia bacterium]